MKKISLLFLFILLIPVHQVYGKTYDKSVNFATQISSSWGQIKYDYFKIDLNEESEFDLYVDFWEYDNNYFYISMYKGISLSLALSRLENGPWYNSFRTITIYQSGSEGDGYSDLVLPKDEYVIIFWVYHNPSINANDKIGIELNFDPINQYSLILLISIPILMILLLEIKHRNRNRF